MTTAISRYLLTLLVLFADVATAEECVFSKEYIPVQRLNQSPGIDIYRWNANSDEIKGVLKSGNLFSIKYWSCAHFGTQALMYIDPQTDISEEGINTSIAELASLALANEEAQQVNKVLLKRKVQLTDLPVRLEIDSTSFDEFYVAANIVNNAIIIEIKLAGS